MTQSQRQRADRPDLNGRVRVVHGRREYLRPDEVGLRPQLMLARGLHDWHRRAGKREGDKDEGEGEDEDDNNAGRAQAIRAHSSGDCAALPRSLSKRTPASLRQSITSPRLVKPMLVGHFRCFVLPPALAIVRAETTQQPLFAWSSRQKYPITV